MNIQSDNAGRVHASESTSTSSQKWNKKIHFGVKKKKTTNFEIQAVAFILCIFKELFEDPLYAWISIGFAPKSINLISFFHGSFGSDRVTLHLHSAGDSVMVASTE